MNHMKTPNPTNKQVLPSTATQSKHVSTPYSRPNDSSGQQHQFSSICKVPDSDMMDDKSKPIDTKAFATPFNANPIQSTYQNIPVHQEDSYNDHSIDEAEEDDDEDDENTLYQYEGLTRRSRKIAYKKRSNHTMKR